MDKLTQIFFRFVFLLFHVVAFIPSFFISTWEVMVFVYNDSLILPYTKWWMQVMNDVSAKLFDLSRPIPETPKLTDEEFQKKTIEEQVKAAEEEERLRPLKEGDEFFFLSTDFHIPTRPEDISISSSTVGVVHARQYNMFKTRDAAEFEKNFINSLMGAQQ
jgi:hypothetical protein